MDFEKMADSLLETVRGFVSRSMQPLIKRIADLESRAPEKGEKGEKGENGKDGDNGLDGKSVTVEEVAVAFERRFSDLSLHWERQASELFQRAIDKMPKPGNGKDGRDGTDGLGFDDMQAEFDGERTVTLRWVRGESVKEFVLTLPVVIDRGFWKEGLSLSKGDGVTFGGSYWIAQKDTDTKPDTANPDFRLAVKKGRDGKDGLNGKNL